MNTAEIENVILTGLYDWWIHNRGGSVYAFREKLEGADEKQFSLVLDDLEESDFIKDPGFSTHCMITAAGIRETEKRELISEAVVEENVFARSAIVQAAFQIRESEGRHADTNLDDVIRDFELNDNTAFRNASMMEDLGWIEFRTTRLYAITRYGRDLYRQQLDEAMAETEKKDVRTFETQAHIYTFVRQIGQGGVGFVYEVVDESGDTFALKIISEEVFSTEKAQRFRQELAFLTANRHNNLVPVLDDGFVRKGEKKLPFFVMPKFNETLRDLLKHKIDPEKALSFFGDLLSGIEFLHSRRNFHRDLKPENILYDKAEDRLIIADLGAAHFAEEELFTAIETQNQERLGNAIYAAPEQRVRGRAKEVDHRSDVWALGLILNQMFTGEVLHGVGHRTVGHVCPEFEGLDDLIHRMVQQSPDSRYGSIAEVKSTLEEILADKMEEMELVELERNIVNDREMQRLLPHAAITISNTVWANGTLRFNLSFEPDARWRDIFSRPPDNLRHFAFSNPKLFTFDEDSASISAHVSEQAPIVDFVSNYLPVVNELYAQSVEVEKLAEWNKQKAEIATRSEALLMRRNARKI